MRRETRHCGYCNHELQTTDPRKHYCDAVCRLADWRARNASYADARRLARRRGLPQDTRAIQRLRGLGTVEGWHRAVPRKKVSR